MPAATGARVQAEAAEEARAASCWRHEWQWRGRCEALGVAEEAEEAEEAEAAATTRGAMGAGEAAVVAAAAVEEWVVALLEAFPLATAPARAHLASEAMGQQALAQSNPKAAAAAAAPLRSRSPIPGRARAWAAVTARAQLPCRVVATRARVAACVG